MARIEGDECILEGGDSVLDYLEKICTAAHTFHGGIWLNYSGKRIFVGVGTTPQRLKHKLDLD